MAVGFDGKLMFNPNNITELVGTVVEFDYLPKVSSWPTCHDPALQIRKF